MTDPNRRRNIVDEIARTDQALRAAEMLGGSGLSADSVSRSWYATYHALRALLLARGLEARTQSGAIHLFNREFVSAGLFPTSHNRLLSTMQGSRELADYDAAVVFSEEDARANLDDARCFAASVRKFLVAEGWITA